MELDSEFWGDPVRVYPILEDCCTACHQDFNVCTHCDDDEWFRRVRNGA